MKTIISLFVLIISSFVAIAQSSGPMVGTNRVVKVSGDTMTGGLTNLTGRGTVRFQDTNTVFGSGQQSLQITNADGTGSDLFLVWLNAHRKGITWGLPTAATFSIWGDTNHAGSAGLNELHIDSSGDMSLNAGQGAAGGVIQAGSSGGLGQEFKLQYQHTRASGFFGLGNVLLFAVKDITNSGATHNAAAMVGVMNTATSDEGVAIYNPPPSRSSGDWSFASARRTLYISSNGIVVFPGSPALPSVIGNISGPGVGISFPGSSNIVITASNSARMSLDSKNFRVETNTLIRTRSTEAFDVRPDHAAVTTGDITIDTENHVINLGRTSTTPGDSTTVRHWDRDHTSKYWETGAGGNYFNNTGLFITHGAGGRGVVAPYRFEVAGAMGALSGNFTNFISAPTNTASFPIITTNDYVVGTRYTNTAAGGFSAQRAWVSASFTLTAAAAGTAKVTLYVETAGVRTNRLSIAAGPLASLVTVEPLGLPVGPNAIWSFVDETSGTGASVGVVTLTSSYIGM